MLVDFIDEQELYEALRPFRTDRTAFELGVQGYLRGRAALAEQDPARNLPPLARAAAAVLPLPLLTGGKVSSSASVTTGGAGQKLLGIALFPAVSMFLLLGATILSVIGLRGTRYGAGFKMQSPTDYDAAIRGWWRENWLPALLLYGGMLALTFFNIAAWMFLLLIASFGLVVLVVRSLAQRGLGNRTILAGTLMTPLILFGQLTMMFNFGDGEIHFLDPRIVSYVFWMGLFCLGCTSFWLLFGRGRSNRHAGLLIMLVMYFPAAILLLSRVHVPPSPLALKQHVEAFDQVRFNSATWRQWEILARWTIEAGLSPDLAKPRALLAQELTGEQNPFILAVAFRVGLIEPGDLPKLHNLEARKRGLLNDCFLDRRNDPLLSVEQDEWVIRALVVMHQLNDNERDFLASRLHATLYRAADSEFEPLRELLLVTQLLAAIDRPVKPEEFRNRIHSALLRLHGTDAGGFQPAGGFKSSTNSPYSDPSATVFAVELMRIYGVPKELDINWVRSYAKPELIGGSTREWTSVVTRGRLAALPDLKPPTLWQWLYYERNLLAAIVLVGLCIYAVRLSPVVNPEPPAFGNSDTSNGEHACWVP